MILAAIDVLASRLTGLEGLVRGRKPVLTMNDVRRSEIKQAMKHIRFNFPRSCEIVEQALEEAYGKF